MSVCITIVMKHVLEVLHTEKVDGGFTCCCRCTIKVILHLQSTFLQKFHTVYFSSLQTSHNIVSIHMWDFHDPIPLQLSAIYTILFWIKTIALGHVDIY